METIEGNKLIAEFMQYELRQEKQIGKFISGGNNYCYVGENFMCTEAEWQPENNWNQLMPVVEKIESIKIKHSDNTNPKTKTKFKVIIHRFCCDIQNDNDYLGDHIIEVTGKKNKITATWLAVIEFIKWYNQNK